MSTADTHTDLNPKPASFSLPERIVVGLCRIYAISTIALSILTLTIATADAAPNRVLQLDGHGDWVQLPQDIFADLDEATVEAWIKWDRLGYYSEPFGFGSGEQWRTMVVNNSENSPDLQFFLYVDAKLYHIRVNDVLS